MTKTILIAEDDRPLARMWSEILTREGFAVVVERDGEWALKTFKAREVDCVILDCLLPVRNGFQVAERIRKLPEGRNVPIVMVSGIYRGLHHRHEAKAKYRVEAYLDKPVKNEELLALLRKIFGDAYPSAARAEEDRARVEAAPDESFATEESREEVALVEEVSRRAFRGHGVGRGDLADRPFPELLAELYRWKATGALLLRRDRVKKIVYLKDGYPISVKSNLLSECLGKVMVRERMITEAQCERSLELMRSSGRMQGTVLIEMGLISPHNLVYALEQQLRTKLLEVFSWTTGSYQFTPRTELPSQTVTLDGTPASLIADGVLAKWTAARARARLGPVSAYYVQPSADPLYRFQELDLSPEAEGFVAQIDGKKTVDQLVRFGPLDEGTAYKLLYALKAAQVITLSETRAKTPASAAEPPRLPKGKVRPPPLKGRRRSGALLPEVAGLATRVSTAADRSLKKKLRTDLEEMRRQTYFEILGVSRDAQPGEIQKAFFSLAREYHPDKIAGSMADEVKQLAGEIYDLVTRAYETLCDPEERNAYLQQISSGPRKKEMSDEVSKILAAEGKFQRGETHLRKGRYQEAYAAFQEAAELYPEEGEFHAYLGWAAFQRAPSDAAAAEEALDHIMRAIQLNPKLDKAYLFLGYLYKALGRADKAEKQFEKAIQCNPDCTEALRELRLFSSSNRNA